MPTEVKQRKKAQKVSDEVSETLNGTNETQNMRLETGKHAEKTSSGPDFKSLLCFLSLAACGALSWMVLQHNDKFAQMEEKYKSLQGKTSRLFDMEEEIVRVSQKLAASEDDLQLALSTVSLATRLQRDVSALHAAVADMQTEESSASHDLQAVNAHFLNVTETWQERLAAINTDLIALKTESREGHAGATERVNEAERRARSLGKKLEELEDSTRRNARALERAEEDDAKRAQEQLDWNSKQIQRLQEQVGGLSRAHADLDSQLQEVAPRAQECEEHLPQVEEAVRSILRLGGDLSGAEKRLEDLTLQVFGTEDSMLKALNEILQLRRELDTLQAHNSILKMKSELSVVKQAVSELTAVLRESRADGGGEADAPTDEEWTDGDPEEEWKMNELEDPTE